MRGELIVLTAFGSLALLLSKNGAYAPKKSAQNNIKNFMEEKICVKYY